MNRSELIALIRRKKSVLCIGLDSDINRIPSWLKEFDDPVFEFNKRIIDTTAPYCVAYKPNIAFYESLGSKGWVSLQKTLDYIPETHLKIADAKRGDIGNSAKQYAKTFFKTFRFDAMTVAPYMGSDSVLPFLEFQDKWTILLALTSNEGADDFQFTENTDGIPLYEQVIKEALGWGTPDNMMFVVGATRPEPIERIRKIAPDHFLLVPGVGTQGGDVQKVLRAGLNKDAGLLINASRSILFADSGDGFAHVAAKVAKSLQQSMQPVLEELFEI